MIDDYDDDDFDDDDDSIGDDDDYLQEGDDDLDPFLLSGLLPFMWSIISG